MSDEEFMVLIGKTRQENPSLIESINKFKNDSRRFRELCESGSFWPENVESDPRKKSIPKDVQFRHP
ncbi:MAG: hypothetical protein AB1384_14715 [Actinomycetota bacterium]